MTNPNGAVTEKPDDLEITSIGSLYSGQWDKKYWSSSRGKDRYPYPIGYGAVRAHNGSSYKMEIQEGPKGPLFLISGAEGQSFSGQTPDIAWEKLQKKCFPRTKIWHGKRYSCKIDGVEFFGFKNPFVQRLLRELAADVNRAAEKSLLPSSFCIGASGTDVANHSPVACTDLETPPTMRKRSRKSESGNTKSSTPTGIKKTRTDDLVSNSEALGSVEGNKMHSNNENPMTSYLNEEHTNTLDVVVADGLLTKSQPEEEIKSDTSSQNLDFDSVGQEMARSMMEFLLPQAIPLLKKRPRKKKGAGSPPVVPPRTVDSQNKINETTASSPGLILSYGDTKEETTHSQYTDLGLSASTKIIIPDSLDDEQYGDHVANHLILLSDKGETDQYQSEDSRRLQECGEHILESLPVCASPHKKAFSEVIIDESYIDECRVGSTISSERTNETAVDITEAINIVGDNQRGMQNSSKLSEKEISAKEGLTETIDSSLSKVPKVVYTRRKIKTTSNRKGNNSVSVSETNICKINAPETYPSTQMVHLGSDNNSNIRDSAGAEVKIVGPSSLYAKESSLNSNAVLNSVCPAILQDQGLSVGEKDTYPSDLSVSHLENLADKNVLDHVSLLQFKENETSHKKGSGFSFDHNSLPFRSSVKPHKKEHNNGIAGKLELLGCYTQPVPVLSVMLSTMGNYIYVSVLCGLLVGKDFSLFIYKVAIEEATVGHPSLIGHTLIAMPDLTEYLNGMAPGRFFLQFIPHGQCLVLLDRIRTPFCREGKTHCLCTTCASSFSEENAVKIVEIKLGYVSLVRRLKAAESQRFMLVCEPNNLISVGKSGRLHLWVMDSTWSAQMEYTVMPSEDCISPGIVDLKKVPNCSHLIVGHNGYGEFSLWDISKRILVSRFCAPSSSILQFIPISLFAWQENFLAFSHLNMEEYINQMMASTSKTGSSYEGEDVAICLLISSSDSDGQQEYDFGNCHLDPVGEWKLALMVKNIVIFGTALDSRASVIGYSGGEGICGTCDGLVYMWELSSGTKLGTIHHFKGGRVSCISNDASWSGAVAIAGDNQVLLYLRNRNHSVYDVSTYLNHPGGDDVILATTGKDATDEIEDAGHSRDASEKLEEDASDSPEPEAQPAGCSEKLMTLTKQYWAVPAAVVGILYLRKK